MHEQQTICSPATVPQKSNVQQLYNLGDLSLVVASDHLSAFGRVFEQPIPGKGGIFTRISNFWFERTEHIVPNHIVKDVRLSEVVSSQYVCERIADRAVVVRKCKPLPIKGIVRGYLTGTAWDEYKKTGSVCGNRLSEGLHISNYLSEPIFTAALKATEGEKDVNISFEKLVHNIGFEQAMLVRDYCLQIYIESAEYALERGIIIADTSLSFGELDNELILIDVALTPDTSRFWAASNYRAGIRQPCIGKQYIREYLKSIGWNKKQPTPELPDHIIDQTRLAFMQLEGDLTA